jgi:hypothetical protein
MYATYAILCKMKRTTIWLTEDQRTRLDVESYRRRMSVAELIRHCIDVVTADATPYPGTADPILQAVADGIRKEATSRGLSPDTIVQLWFQMMLPVLPAQKMQSDALNLNITADEEPTS